jgi:hypothetical protein
VAPAVLPGRDGVADGPCLGDALLEALDERVVAAAQHGHALGAQPVHHLLEGRPARGIERAPAFRLHHAEHRGAARRGRGGRAEQAGPARVAAGAPRQLTRQPPGQRVPRSLRVNRTALGEQPVGLGHERGVVMPEEQ